MDYLSIDVPILERTNTILIEIPYGFENEIQFNITDKEISESAAILYIEQPTGLPLTSICSVSENVVKYTPKPNDFFPGNNICQIRVGQDLSMNIVVRCHRGAYVPSIDITDGSLAAQVIEKCEEVLDGFNSISESIKNKIQYREIEVTIGDDLPEGGHSSGVVDVSDEYPSAKKVVAIGGRRSGTQYVCNATIEDNKNLYCTATSSGVYKVTIIGFY